MTQEQRTFRIMQIVFFAFAASLFWMIHTFKPEQPVGPLLPVYEAIAGLAVVDSVIGIVIRRMFLTGAVGKPRPGVTVSPVKRWFLANVLGLAFALSTCLFGLVLHVLSAPDWLAQALVGLGIVVMIGFLFGRPPAAEPGNSPYASVE